MNCIKCGSQNVNCTTSAVVKSVRRSFLWNLFMICITGGFWLLWMLIRRRKEKVVMITTATCNDCGRSWQVK